MPQTHPELSALEFTTFASEAAAAGGMRRDSLSALFHGVSRRPNTGERTQRKGYFFSPEKVEVSTYCELSRLIY